MADYVIAVGKRHKVEPRQIVGAIANEGGLSRTDFGHIDIRGDHSVVELPADLPSETWQALERTRISGKLIELSRAGEGGSGGRSGAGRSEDSRRTPRGFERRGFERAAGGDGAGREDGPRKKKPRTKK